MQRTEPSHRFFSNKQCMFFPCHSQPDENEFNCMFCYCPLYPLGDDCGGVFTWVKHGDIKIKLCTDCHLPHTPEYYDVVMDKLSEENISSFFTPCRLTAEAEIGWCKNSLRKFSHCTKKEKGAN